MMSRFHLVCSLALALTAFSAGSTLGAKTILMHVANQPEPMKVQTTSISDQMCLPVRSVADMMGAKVSYDKKTRVITVSGTAGTAVLRLGDRHATINGTRVSFPIPPFMYGGRVFAPLGFYNNYLNMGLIWDPFRQAYRWVQILPPTPYPAPPVIYGPGSGTDRPTSPDSEASSRRVVGEVIRVRPSAADPTITVGLSDREITYRIAAEVTILRGRVGGRAMEVPLSEIRPGDRATLSIDASGSVRSVRAHYQEVRGSISSISEGQIVLDSGRSLDITEQTRVVLPGNARGRIEDLSLGDQLIASVSPISGEAYLISVQRTAPTAERRSNIYLNTYGPLSTGDILRVTFRASAGGRASMTIPGLLTDAAMAETAPGVYEAQYTIKPGDVLASEPVSVALVTSDGARYEVRSARPVTIATDSAVLPRIISPRTGQSIGSPIVVRGLAHPNARIRVTVEFLRNIGGILPMEGLSGSQEVSAGADGIWKTSPLPATAPWEDITTELPDGYGILDPLYELDYYPTTFLITATEIGAGGNEIASYSVQPIRGPVKVGL